MNKGSFEKILRKAVREYNKYRSPEANARIVSTDKGSFKIEFTGPYCRTCGFYDYFEDLVYVLEDFGVKSKIDEVSETDYGAIVSFSTDEKREPN
jgi:superoxide reductase